MERVARIPQGQGHRIRRSAENYKTDRLVKNQGIIFKGRFHGGNTGSNPVGDAKPFQQLTVSPPPLYRHKKGTILAINANALHRSGCISHRSRHFEQAQVRNTSSRPVSTSSRCRRLEETNDAALRTPLLNCDGLGICIQCDPAGGVAKEFLRHLDICSVCSEQ